MKVWLTGFVLVTLSALALAAPSSAAVSPAGNVPYLAWNGQQVRVARCLGFDHELDSSELDGVRTQLQSVEAPGVFVLEDWSGATDINSVPRWTSGSSQGTSTATQIEINRYGICWSARLSAVKPGMAVIKLAVSVEALANLEFALEGGDVLVPDLENVSLLRDTIVRHQFLVIFMTLGAPTLTNLGSSIFVAGDTGTDLKATLRGSFPLGNDYAGMFAGDVVTLPDQWADLANRLAFDDSGPNAGIPGSAPMLWDIHDDTLPTTGHAPGSCGSGIELIDAVDNCLGGTLAGPFSFTLAGAGLVSSAATYGPYDPLFLDDTLLSDGKLDAGDAPMPPARVDFLLGAASAGSLVEVSKTTGYSRDGSGAATAGNLFAPFYASYIPAAGSPSGRENGSGIAGAFANNYPGFIENGIYEFWHLMTFAEETGSDCRDVLGTSYSSFVGVTHASSYTDEHGETRAHYLPNQRILPTPDGNNRCDLGPADGVVQTVGAPSITARSVYPDQPVFWDSANKTSSSVVVIVQERAGSSLACVPNGVGESLCFAVSLDLAGAPVAGAQVRFTRSPLGTIEPATAAAGGFDPAGQGVVSASADEVVLTTNAQGTAGVRLVTSPPNPVQVTAQLLGTRWTPTSPGVTRQATIDTSVFDQTEETAPPGGTVSTGDLPSPTDPVQTSVTTPSGGAVTVVESSQTPSGPAGYTFLDKQVTITAPLETPGNPLTLIFQIDASALGGADPSTLAIFRNGVLVPGCTGSPGVADPAPTCVASRTSLPGGGAQFIVLTEAASVWTFARRAACVGPPPPGAIVRGSGNHTINGTSGDDVIVDMAGNNTINGNGGNDTICTGPGNDKVDGGAGNDTIIDTGGNNQVDGGPGVDTLTTGAGNDKVDGGAGDDTINAGDGTNQVSGGVGDDAIAAGTGSDTIDGSAGIDTINAGAGANQVDGGAGDDAIATGASADKVSGGLGDDTVVDVGGTNDVSGGEGADTITTGSGNDKVDGGIGNDTINAGGGNNQVDGRAGADSITTGSGNDKIDGGPGFDTCHPGAGTNTVTNCEA